MVSVVLFGSLGVAVETLEWLLTKPEVEVRGVVCSREEMTGWRLAVGDRNMAAEAPRLGVPIFDLDDVPEADLGLAVFFHQILRRRHLDRFGMGVVNTHPAPLPEMRGSLCQNIALYEGLRDFGATLHWMDEGVDTGDVIATGRFHIRHGISPLDLLRDAFTCGAGLIRKHFDAIATNKAHRFAQAELIARGAGCRTFRRAEVLEFLALKHAA